MKINVMGLDPAFRNLGYVLAEYDVAADAMTPFDIGLITTEKSATKGIRVNSDNLRCAVQINLALCKAIEFANIKFIFAEIPQGAQNAQAAHLLGITTGIIATLPARIIQLTPRDIKKIVNGTQIAPKREVIAWAMQREPRLDWAMRKVKGQVVSNDGKNEHMADALATLEAGLLTEQWADVKATLRFAI